VLAIALGCRVGVLPIEQLRFLRGLIDLGGDVYESSGPDGPQRRIATFLPARTVESVLRDLPGRGEDGPVHAQVSGDVELGVSVVTLSVDRAADWRLDLVAQAVAAKVMVEELIAPVVTQQP